MATPAPSPGRGAQGQFHPDAQGNYHTGNSFFDRYYKGLDEQVATFEANPEVAALIASKGSGTVNKVVGDTDVKVENGVITHTSTGGVWKPLLAAGAVAATAATLGAASPAIAGALGPSTAANMAATSAVVGGSTVPASLAAVGGTTAALGGVGGLTGAALKYGAPLAGNLVSQYLQNNATKDASAITQKYLQEALDYEKSQTVIDRKLAADKVNLEASRYGDYSGRIAPYLATGASANDRMASLLGLPSGGGGSSVSRPVAAAPASAPPALPWATPSAPAPSAPAPVAPAWSDAPAPGVTPGVAGGGNPSPAAPGPIAPQVQPDRVQAEATVQMRAPNGQTKAVPQSQVEHYRQLGAELVEGAA